MRVASHHHIVIWLFAALLVWSGCNSDDISDEQEAQNYLNTVLEIMENNSIHRYEIDWEDFRQKVTAKAVGARSIPQTYPAIIEALKLLGDNHSIYIKPDGSYIYYGGLSCLPEPGITPEIPDHIGYVHVDGFAGSSSGSKARNFAYEIQDQIRQADHDSIVGWIVDLRGNGGGNMWPMLAGIGPVLGEGVAGYFIDPDNVSVSWGYSEGASVLDEGTTVVRLDSFYTLINENPKVAVLIEDGIASSGEVMAISFVGRSNTRSFGSSTCGLSTSNVQFALSDDAILNLTTAYLADRNRKLYGVPVQVDEPVPDDQVVSAAIDWLEN